MDCACLPDPLPKISLNPVRLVAVDVLESYVVQAEPFDSAPIAGELVNVDITKGDIERRGGQPSNPVTRGDRVHPKRPQLPEVTEREVQVWPIYLESQTEFNRGMA